MLYIFRQSIFSHSYILITKQLIYAKKLSILISISAITIYLIIATNFVSTVVAQKEDDDSYHDNSSIKKILYPNNGNNTLDKFGIKKIYPTSEGGREWFVNMNNPKNDSIFSITSNENISRQSDGSWRIAASKVRMNVNTPVGEVPWKNVEITGYAKIMSLLSPNNTDLSWYARGGRHNSYNPCEGTAVKGIIDMNSTVGWEKEIWHTGGDTNTLSKTKVADSIIGKWIGLKTVMYNIDNDTAVKMETFLDKQNTNNWTKVTDLIDNGGWYATSTDKEFYSAGCNKPKDYIVTNPGSIVTFRSDNIVWDFKNLSVREIKSCLTC